MVDMAQTAEPEIAVKGLDYLTETGQTGGSALPVAAPARAPEGPDSAHVPEGSSRGLDDMVSGGDDAAAMGGWPSVDLPDDVAAGRASIQRAKTSSDDALIGRMDSRLEEDRARIKSAYDATAMGPNELPKWDYEKQRERTRTNPMESFGSIASLFAMTAALFTKAPMENALLGSAAAMNAIKAGNDKEYEDAFGAWKANTDLALKRHNIMQQRYQDSIQLMTTDMAASRQQLALNAARYEDHQLLFLMEHGMDKEAFELLDKRNVMMTNAAKAMETITKSGIQREMLQKDPEFNNQDQDAYKRAARKLNAFDRIYHPAQTVEKEVVAQYLYENPGATAQEVAAFRNDFFGYGARPLSAEQSLVQQILASDKNDMEKQDLIQKILDKKKAGGAGMSAARPGSEAETLNTVAEKLLASGEATDRADALLKAKKQISDAGRKKPMVAEEIERRAAEYAKPEDAGGKGMSKTEAFNKASQEVKRSQLTPTGNRIDDNKRITDTIQLSRATLDKAETLLNRHFGITGIGGAITRPMEAAGNMTAISSETDRAQFRRFIDEVKEWAPTILLQRTGRPLAAEAARLDRIIAGINAGDTAANTKRAFKELRETWNMIEGQLDARITGEPGTPKTAPTGDGWWRGLKDKAKE